jgi:hypothetical protein
MSREISQMPQKDTIRAEITRKNIDYIVDVGINEDFFTIHIEEADTGSRWWGEFTAKGTILFQSMMTFAKAIEHLTSKTGNLKKFSVFTKMLIGKRITNKHCDSCKRCS